MIPTLLLSRAGISSSPIEIDVFSNVEFGSVSKSLFLTTLYSVSPTVKFRNTYRIMNKSFNLNDTSKLDENIDVFG